MATIFPTPTPNMPVSGDEIARRDALSRSALARRIGREPTPIELQGVARFHAYVYVWAHVGGAS